MALKRKGRAPAAKAKAEPAAEASEIASVQGATAKLTVSVKRRMTNGDEMFIAPGVEMHCTTDELDETQASVTERVHAWLDELLQAYPDTDPVDEDDEDEEDDEGEDDDADEGEDDEDDEAEDEEDDLTEADIKKMKKAELIEFVKDEELDIETKGMSVADLKAAIIEELFSEEDDEDEDEEADEDDEDEDEEEGYTEEELAELDLKELQEIVDAWELEHPKFKKGTKLAAKKKAYTKLILEEQDEEED